MAEPLESVLISIADMDRSAAAGARVRARVKWAEEGESSSKYFLHQEYKRDQPSDVPPSVRKMAPLPPA